MTEEPKVRLLIVDDEVAHLRALRDTLQDHGYEAVGCTSGEAGLAALRAAPYDLLLTDLMMPGMDGITVLRSALQLDPMLVVIIMTGAGTISSAVEAMQAGALDYILKPFKLSTMLPVLQRGLVMRRLWLENAALERRVRERTAELEAANMELEAFTRSASHDLRSPLNGIMGFSNLLSDKYGALLPDQAREWLGQIELAGTRMNQLIGDLLRLSHLGRQALRLEQVDVSALVHEVAAELSVAQPERRVSLHIDALPPAMADASLLRQAFVNLLSNAYKFTVHAQPARIEVSSELQSGECVYLVRDNGAGFDMASADRLFNAFERLHSAEEFEGNGVGLSIVQRIVQRHGGRIWAQASPGRGATFFFTLGAGAESAPSC